ncbi:MAG: hypothetical protein ABIG11_10350 [bacterium]
MTEEQKNTEPADESGRAPRSRKFWAVMIILDLALFGAFSWVLYSRISLHYCGSAGEMTPEPVPVELTRPVMPKPIDLPPALEIVKSTPTTASSTAPESAREVFSGTRTVKASVPSAKKTASKPTATTETAASKPVPAPPVQKARRVDFEYWNPQAKTAAMSGSFTKWKDREMKKEGGTWKITLFIHPGKYLYHLKVDGKKVLDPSQPLRQKGESYLVVIPDN